MADVQQETSVETPFLTVTPVALTKIRQLMDERELAGVALRVFVQGGGCSGFSYGMAFEPNFYPQDQRVEVDGVQLVIDPNSLMYMHGSEIDYVDSLMGGGFAINNPNAVSTCGCGHSFRTEDDAAEDAYGDGGCGCGSGSGCGGH